MHLLTGHDFWTTRPTPKIGLRRMLLSDGPSGVRGEMWDERDPSLCMPSITALASSWDRTLAQRYGAVAALEARRKGVDVVLGPTVNLHRSPLGGRNFESFSEDPLLTTELAAAYVQGMQGNGVAATPKHYVANDWETDRFAASSVVSERALRELYLFAFERTVTKARAWLVMTAYNAINGVSATENDLLESPLNTEWDFDGVVVSDWGAVRSVGSAAHSQDLIMPGPNGPWGQSLVDAVRAGRITSASIDRKVLRLLRLAARVGALEGFAQAEPVLVEDPVAFIRETASAGMVLLHNRCVEGTPTLPLNAARLRTIAVIGHNAQAARIQGGGSATVMPENVVTPLEGIRAAFPDAAITYAAGGIVQEGIAEIPLNRMTNPVTGEPGVRVSFLNSGEEIRAEDRRSTALVWFGADSRIEGVDTLRLTTAYLPEETGTLLLGVSTVGQTLIEVNGNVVLDCNLTTDGRDLGANFLSPPAQSAAVEVHAGVPIDIIVTYTVRTLQLGESLSFRFGIEPDQRNAASLLEKAVTVAASADLAILVVGTNSQVESEGIDRTSILLPGNQDELVRRVAAANPRTIVVVNSGAPVALPWREDVDAILLGWFGGQEMGNALGDVLTGAIEPGGRLTTTWPERHEDAPVVSVAPTDGKLHYQEGIHIGYRAWARSANEPAYPFGHGLGYTSWELSSPKAGALANVRGDQEAALLVRIKATNTGTRAGKHVVQVYASRLETTIERPSIWLAGFATVHAAPGETVNAEIPLDARVFSDWRNGVWAYEPGEFILHIGSSVADLPLTLTAEVLPDFAADTSPRKQL